MTNAKRIPRPRGGLPAAIVRHRVALVILWLCAIAALAPFALKLQDRLTAASRMPQSESAAVEAILSDRFASRGAGTAWVAVSGVEDMGWSPGREALRDSVAALGANRHVARVHSYLDAADPFFLGANGQGAVILLELASGPDSDRLVRSLDETVATLGQELRRRFPEAEVQWTADFALDVDLLRSSEKDVRAGELRALPATFLLLVLAFGALVAAVCPIVLAVLAIVCALGVASLVSGAWQPSVLLQNIVSLLGLALGIDYSLLIVSRFREYRAAGLAPEPAAEASLRRAGRSVVLSGGAVAVGFLALLIVPIDELRSVALGGLLVVVSAVSLATTFLPAWLIWLGDRLNLGRVPLGRTPRIRAEHWRLWGLWIARRPWTALLVSGALLAALAYPARWLDVAFPGEGWLPREMASVRGLESLEALGRSGPIYRHLVLLELPEGVAPLGAQGWQAMVRFQAALAADDRVAAIYSLPALVGPGAAPAVLAAYLPADVKTRFLDRGERISLFEVVPRGGLGPKDLMDMVEKIRNIEPPAPPGGAEGRILVGGIPAATLDYQTTVQRWLPVVVALVLGGSFVVLLVGFRSVLIPIKAVLVNLLPVMAAFGLLSLVFLRGIGLELFGLDEPLQGIFPALPVIIFCTVYGISMDYEVFLVSRIAEARATQSDADAIAQGLAQTGGIITGAGAIMIAVFGAFAVGDFLPIQMLGLALAAAVLLDVTLVRMILGPALIRIAGRWNWWPGGPK